MPTSYLESKNPYYPETPLYRKVVSCPVGPGGFYYIGSYNDFKTYDYNCKTLNDIKFDCDCMRDFYARYGMEVEHFTTVIKGFTVEYVKI